MTSRERVTSLLRHELPDRMGLYEHFWPETLAEYWPREGYPEGQAPETHFGYDIVNCGGWFNSEPCPGRHEVLDETDEWRVVRDGRGAALKYWKHKSGTPEHIGFTITTPEAWRDVRESLLTVDRGRLGDPVAARAAIAAARESGRYAVFGNLFVFELMRATIGDENFLPALLTEPDWIRDFCQVYLDSYRAHYEVLFRESGLPDGFFVYEDLGYRNGLFCSPKVLADLVMPYEAAFVGFLKDYGLPVILHSCGDIRRAVPLLVEAGFDCLQPMEAKAGCDVVQIASEFGSRLAYMGNIDVVALTTNDRDTVRDAVVPKLRRLKEMRVPYFFHSDHSIPPNVRLDTYGYALDLLREHGTYA
ncbi:MAG: hypothetical protein IT208_02150 [Chthonomonadales bacterium]|nr:hypothetical protein [Chthonomonadales bacterium]